MEKYLGNKATILPLIEGFIKERIPEARSLSDVFAGTNNVSRYFRARGWKTSVCDANRFSYVLAQSYLSISSKPPFQSVRTCSNNDLQVSQLQTELVRSISRYGQLYLPSGSSETIIGNLEPLARVLAHLQIIGDDNRDPGLISRYFTQWGDRSEYVSLRGTKGKRNYFSRGNALALDAILQRVREWWSTGLLTRTEVFLLLTCVIEEVVITANVNGTFHDFNRDRLWPNAEQTFRLRLPIASCEGASAEIANADAIMAAKVFGKHDVCYLDPPYNFRQYSAYYHFLNFISAFPFLDDVEDYLEGISQVRGQHPEDNFTSNFCSRKTFISSLRSLIGSVDSSHVVLSYYGGRNHWNHWSSVSEPTDEGLAEIRTLFEDASLFSHSEIIPALEIRKNYQSRVGEQKSLVNEYLFHGVRADNHPLLDRRSGSVPPLASNERWGLSDKFAHTGSSRQDFVDNPIRAAS